MNKLKDYKDLLEEYSNVHKHISYSELLFTTEWKTKRDVIAQREGHNCERCKKATTQMYIPSVIGHYNPFVIKKPAEVGFKNVTTDYIDPYTKEKLFEYEEEVPYVRESKNPLFGHVHHTFYVNGCMPWEYRDEDLQFLCHFCHAEIHTTTKIFTYDNYINRVDGIPIVSCDKCFGTGYLSEFEYHKDGICFQCNGRGHEKIYT